MFILLKMIFFFPDQQIDGASLLLLDDVDFKDVIPILGPRKKFVASLRKLPKVNTCTF